MAVIKTKVRVKRTELLKIVEGRLRKAEREHERAVANHPAAVEAYTKAVIAKLENTLARVQAGKPLTLKYGSQLELGSPPVRPSENGHELCNLRRLHKTLQIGAEDSILLSQEDADSYFGPCAL